MRSVPLWVLTAVIEVGLLGIVALGILLGLLWRSQRRLRSKMMQVEPASGGYESEEGVPEDAAPTVAEVDVDIASRAGEAGEATSATGAAEEKPGLTLSQESLDDRFVSAQEEQEDTYTKAQQNVTALLSESTAMATQIAGLQENSRSLHDVVESLHTNAGLPPEERQETPAPEVIIQEVEKGLAALQRTNERMKQKLQAHCQLLGIGEDVPANMEPQPPNGQEEAEELRAEIRHLQSELEQRTADFQNIQQEYETLLVEYRRVFERS